MSEKQTIEPGDVATIETPGDEAEAPARPVKPTAANRYQLFDDGQGDYRIYEIAKKDAGLPVGALLPIAEVPGFASSAKARVWINNSGNKLEGKQVLILKGLEICSVQVETVNTVRARFKEKKPVTGPAAEAGEAEGE